MVHQQIVPLEKSLKSVFQGKKYNNFVRDHIQEFNFNFDEKKYQEKKDKLQDKHLEKCI